MCSIAVGGLGLAVQTALGSLAERTGAAEVWGRSVDPPPGPAWGGRGGPAAVRFDFGPPPPGSRRPESIVVRPLTRPDVEVLAFAFRAVPWPLRPASVFRHHLAEQAGGGRLVLVAEADDVVAGYATVAWTSDYPPFRAEAVPEIADLTVVPSQRRRGVATALCDVAEGVIATRSAAAGIACGLHAGFGPAQRFCARRGYLPDGRGAHRGGRALTLGELARLDDATLLMFHKRLR